MCVCVCTCRLGLCGEIASIPSPPQVPCQPPVLPADQQLAGRAHRLLDKLEAALVSLKPFKQPCSEAVIAKTIYS